jgi:hypothetical protein
VRATGVGEQTPAEALFQIAGQEIGTLADILGQTVVSASTLLPEAVKEPVVEGVKSFLSTDIGRLGVQALGKGVEAWEEFREENPRAGRNIEAAFNVGATFVPVKGVSAADLAKSGAKRVAGKLRRGTTRAPVVTSQDLSQLASNSYKRADELGGVLKPEVRDNFITEIQRFVPKEERLLGTKSVFENIVDTVSAKRGQPISLRGAQDIDEQLGDLISREFGVGGLTKEGKQLQQLQSSFRESIENATPKMIEGTKEGFEALKEGRKLWAASRLLRS